MQESLEIKDYVRRFYESMASADAASAIDTMVAHDESALMIGTDPNEWWRGYNTITRIWREQLRATGGFKITPGDLVAFAEGDFGWFADNATWEVEGEQVPVRTTGVVRRENGDWKLVQGHASIGVANEETVGRELPTG